MFMYVCMHKSVCIHAVPFFCFIRGLFFGGGISGKRSPRSPRPLLPLGLLSLGPLVPFLPCPPSSLKKNNAGLSTITTGKGLYGHCAPRSIRCAADLNAVAPVLGPGPGVGAVGVADRAAGAAVVGLGVPVAHARAVEHGRAAAGAFRPRG